MIAAEAPGGSKLKGARGRGCMAEFGAAIRRGGVYSARSVCSCGKGGRKGVLRA